MSILSPAWFTQTITIRDKSGVSAFGDFIFGSAYTMRARVEVKTEVVRGFDGEFGESSHIIYTESPIPPGSMLVVGTNLAFTEGLEPMAYGDSYALQGEDVLHKTWLRSGGR